MYKNKFLINLLKIYLMNFHQELFREYHSIEEYYKNNILSKGLNLKQNNPLYETYNIFTKNDIRENISCFRIPSIIAKKNMLIAFSEARINSCEDCSITGIVSKTSYNGGKNWSEFNWVIPANDRGGNPTTLYDYKKNKIMLYYSRGGNYINSHWDCSPARDNYYISSTNFGKNWSNPVNISKYLGKYKGLLPGPGNAIQTKSGRYIIPGHYLTSNRESGAVISYFSDDNGKTYKISNPIKGMDESSITEYNGKIYMISRNSQNNKKCKCKSISISDNNGQIWNNYTYDKQLKEPICEGNLANIKNILMYVGPNMYYARSNLTIWYKKNINIKWKYLQITDESTYTDYSVISTELIYNKYIGVMWGSCELPLPFRVWCTPDIGNWGFKFTLIPIDKFI